MAEEDPEGVDERPLPAEFTAGANQAAAILWVADNICDPDDPEAIVDDANCPGPNARKMLAWVHKSPANESSFYTRLLPLVMPSRSEMDAMQRQRSDMAAEFALIEKVLAAARRNAKARVMK